MAEGVLADSVAIVAALDKRDQNHAWARAQLDGFTAPCITCEAVLSECFFLLDHLRDGKRALCHMLERRLIQVDFNFGAQRREVLKLLDRYASTPMSFADACLVRMSELFPGSVVFTADSDFEIYRRYGREIIPIMAPW